MRNGTDLNISARSQSRSASTEGRNCPNSERDPFNRSVATWSTLLLLLLMVAPQSLRAASPAYQYHVLAKSGDVIDGITLNDLSTPFISNDQTVLFLADYPDGNALGVMFAAPIATGDKRLVIKQGDSVGGYVVDQILEEKQNDSGEIAFSSNLTGGGLFTLNAPVIVPGQTIGGTPIAFNSAFALNNAGEIVFAAGIPPASTGIFTPGAAIIKSGATISGITLNEVNNPALSNNGVVAFNGVYSTPTNSYSTGVFNQYGVIATQGDSFGGITVTSLGAPAITSFGVVGYQATASTNGLPNSVRSFFIDHSAIAQTGETIDGLTLQTPVDPLAPLDPFALNAGGEALFSSNATNADGTFAGGWFTAKHSVVATGDTVAGITIENLYGASMNDRGQVAFVVS